MRIFSVAIALIAVACVPAWAAEEVIAYVALDEMYSRPILDKFEKKTGIDVRAVFDTEAAKTTGLVTRLLSEKQRPRCDVFWNNEVAQTITLQKKGILEAYVSPAAAAIPGKFKDREAYWTGFAARARVIIYNTAQVNAAPKHVEDLLKAEWRGKGCIANPLFGTTATHGAALFQRWGDERAKEFFLGLNANEVAVLSGNAAVRDMVARGEYAWGLTDTDDAHSGVLDGLPVKWLLPDQDGDGTLLLPNTVALIAGAPNQANGQKLIDYLLSADVERALAESRSMQIPLRIDVETPSGVPRAADIKSMELDYAEVADAMERSAPWFRDEFLK